MTFEEQRPYEGVVWCTCDRCADRENPVGMVELGTCHCGCKTRVDDAEYSWARIGWVKGKPKYFARGHACRAVKRPSREVLVNLYVNQRKTCPEIAKMFNVGRSAAREWLVWYGIERRKHAQTNRQRWRDGMYNGVVNTEAAVAASVQRLIENPSRASEMMSVARHAYVKNCARRRPHVICAICGIEREYKASRLKSICASPWTCGKCSSDIGLGARMRKLRQSALCAMMSPADIKRLVLSEIRVGVENGPALVPTAAPQAMSPEFARYLRGEQ